MNGLPIGQRLPVMPYTSISKAFVFNCPELLQYRYVLLRSVHA